MVQKLPIDKTERGLERLERCILNHFCQTQSCTLLKILAWQAKVGEDHAKYGVKLVEKLFHPLILS